MRIPLMDVQAQHRPLKRQLYGAMKKVLDSGSFIMGEEGRSFEVEFGRLQGARHCLGVSSGTHAIHLALEALGISRGDEVVTTPMSFIATASTISDTGATPVFADIDPRTLNLDPAAVERRLTPRTRAIVAVHLFGYPADLDALRRLAGRRGLALVEDCAQAHLTEYKGRPVGAIGDVGTFSFYPSKNLGAIGDAGAVTTDNADLARRMAVLRDLGRTPGKRYEHLTEGFNYRLDEVQAAILRVKLRKLRAWTATRRKWAALYRRELADLPVALPPEDGGGTKHTYHLFVVRAKDRDALSRQLTARGIANGVYYPLPLAFQPAYKSLGHKPGDFPEAEKASREVLALPLYAEMGAARVRAVAAEVRRFYQGA
jgi:dTDP-4-amino-4,6-dideoxygalactose transaminase